MYEPVWWHVKNGTFFKINNYRDYILYKILYLEKENVNFNQVDILDIIYQYTLTPIRLKCNRVNLKTLQTIYKELLQVFPLHRVRCVPNNDILEQMALRDMFYSGVEATLILDISHYISSIHDAFQDPEKFNAINIHNVHPKYWSKRIAPRALIGYLKHFKDFDNAFVIDFHNEVMNTEKFSKTFKDKFLEQFRQLMLDRAPYKISKKMLNRDDIKVPFDILERYVKMFIVIKTIFMQQLYQQDQEFRYNTNWYGDVIETWQKELLVPLDLDPFKYSNTKKYSLHELKFILNGLL